MANKKIIYGVLIGLVLTLGIASAFNMTIDAKDFELCFYNASGKLIGCYTNETINIGLNDYVIQLEETRYNLTETGMMHHVLDIVRDNMYAMALLIIIFILFSLMVIFYKIWI